MALAMSQHDYYGFPQQLPRSRIPAELSLHSFVDAQGDLSNDSANSPATPLSPVFTNPYHLPVNDDWLTWDDKDALSPDLDANLSFEDDYDFAAPELARDDVLRNVSVSPAVNPVDLAAPMADVVPFGRDGLSDTQPLFQSHAPAPRTAPEPSSASPAASASSSSDARPARKRKSPGSAAPSARSSASPPPTKSSRKPAGLPPKKTAHNMIEKRYRNNLNDKIAALRDSVPSLRVMVQRLEHLSHSDDADEEGDVGEEDLGGLAVAQKLNKATILGKATEYIAHLERKNQSLAKENANLRNQIEGFEVYVTSRGGSQGMWS